jgi:SpoVK/Ycf46/Vps4 family AAA+-type ATPase
MRQEIDFSINNLLDLINIAKKYKYSKKRPRSRRSSSVDLNDSMEYNFDLEKLIGCIDPLTKLNNLIGMEEIKKNIIDQILFYVQELNTNEMMHTCLTGPPGVGKTTLGKILAELYCSLGFLKTNNFRVVSRADLIAGYLGQTALKTLKVLKESIGGVLFIDEAYSLGGNSDESGNSYSRECIDTINKFLSENTSNFILIIAGYKDDLDKQFFSMNKGLIRRFPWTYDIPKYSTDSLKDIFVHQIKSNRWRLESSLIKDDYKILSELFKEYSDLFEQNGGDTLILFDKTKIIHSRRVFCKDVLIKKIINEHDIRSAMELIKKTKKPVKDTSPPFGMYT